MKENKKLAAWIASGIFLAGILNGTANASELNVMGSAGTAQSPYMDVPIQDEAYAEIKELAEAGLVKREYVNFDPDNLATRSDMAVIVANASTKYERADARKKLLIEKLQAEFAPELRGMVIHFIGPDKNAKKEKTTVAERLDKLEDQQKANDINFKLLPHVSGEFKQYYDYQHSSGNGKTSGYNALYQDVRLGLSGKAGDWDYLLGWQIIGVTQSGGSGENWGYRTGTNLDYRNTLNPDMQLFIAQIANWNFYGGQLFLGKFWNGFASNLEPTVYTDAFRGIGYKHPIGKFNVSISYGRIDNNPASAATFDDRKAPIAQRYTVDTTLGKVFCGVGLWRFNDLYNPYSYLPQYGVGTEKMSKLDEFQIRYQFNKDLSLSYFQGDSDAADENRFYILRLKYKEPNVNKIGSFGATIDYHSIGTGSVIDPGIVEMYQNEQYKGLRGLGIHFNFVPCKSAVWKFEINPWNREIADKNVKSTTVRSILDFIF